jgi:23S rRNA (cytidine1920-2'-O)/16S rRNA (cytidine1409-2'-O)-methyltransferase
MKPTRQVTPHDSIALQDTGPRWVSRGAHKLLGALEVFTAQGLLVNARNCLDAGASTGGFTQVLLQAGAAHVNCVDVGYGQLDWSLQSDPRVTVYDRCNIRTLSATDIGERVDLVVADLSFISLCVVLPALLNLVQPDGDLVLMVKPQFEVGRDQIGPRGVVTSPELRMASISSVAEFGYKHGWGAVGVTHSPLPGPSGNVEYFLWLRAGDTTVTPAMITQTVEGGPQ